MPEEVRFRRSLAVALALGMAGCHPLSGWNNFDHPLLGKLEVSNLKITPRSVPPADPEGSTHDISFSLLNKSWSATATDVEVFILFRDKDRSPIFAIRKIVVGSSKAGDPIPMTVAPGETGNIQVGVRPKNLDFTSVEVTVTSAGVR